MEERFGVRGTVLGDVFFTEFAISGARPIKHLHVEISRQNANLIQVKEQLASQVQACGGNVLMGFRYGQKPHPWWQNLLVKWDTESWHGEGDAVRV